MIQSVNIHVYICIWEAMIYDPMKATCAVTSFPRGLYSLNIVSCLAKLHLQAGEVQDCGSSILEHLSVGIGTIEHAHTNSMSLCKCIYAYIYMYTHIYIYVYVYVYIFIYSHVVHMYL